ncbi:hypothetical protein SteCoe_4811 [Stentor coeruleus]|uniref:Uncharacterized protein n=1 Tax=Stentor coeruleus TaxID=5963 RepID=A0A1R2CTW4_9CILI|nr:hypothetical protein SteCoe_4811 [Stentor coeruleus]
MAYKNKPNDLGSFGKIHTSIAKGLKYLEPQCASKRFYIGIPKTIEKAFNEMSITKERFNAEREKLRLGLNTMIKYPQDVHIVNNRRYEHRNDIRYETTPEIILKSSKLKGRSFTPIKKDNSKSPCSRLVEIENVIEYCNTIKEENMKMIKDIPSAEKSFEKSFRMMGKILDMTRKDESERSLTSRSGKRLRKVIMRLVDS